MKLAIVLVAGLLLISGAAQAQADTMLLVKLPNVDVRRERIWDNDHDRYRYNQTKYYVTTILPYLNAATRLFHEIDQKVNDGSISKKERRRFIESKEDEMRDRFENEVKELNTTQGVLLIKLIARQTGVNVYSILQEFKNPMTAIKWQTWARVNGHNLNKRYNPGEEPMLEHIMESLDYPLPPYYTESEQALHIQ